MTGSELRARRTGAGISAQRVAAHLDMDFSQLYKIEREERRMPEGFADRYIAALRHVGAEVAEAVGIQVVA